MKKFVVGLICATIFFTGCTKEQEEKNLVGSQVGQADKINKKDDKDLSISMRSAETLNPLLNADDSVDSILRFVFKPLIEISKDYMPAPSIAESWYFSEEGTSLTINLKKGLRWHDGSEITARDVVYSINTLLNADDNVMYKNSINRVTGAESTNSHTAVVKFRESYCGNIYAMSFPVIPEGYYGNASVSENDKNFIPLGSGSYKVESFVAARELILKATENSFTQVPGIEKINVSITNNADTDVYLFTRRMTDCVLANEDVLGRVDLGKNANRVEFVDNYYEFIGFNFNNSILNKKNVRKSVANAISVEDIIGSVYLGEAVKAQAPINPESALFNKGIVQYEQNLSLAKELLEKEGYIYNEEKRLREKNTDGAVEELRFSILVNGENTERSQAAFKVAEGLNSVGFSVTVEKVPFEQYKTRLENGQFDMFIGGWELSIVPEFGFMFETGSDENYINYSSEKMDNLIAQYRKSVTETSMKDNMKELSKEVAEELPYVGLVFRKSILFTDNRITGDFNAMQFNIYNGIETWEIK